LLKLKQAYVFLVILNKNTDEIPVPKIIDIPTFFELR
jgi:hypothetical protein